MLAIDEENGRISLSIRELQENPWDSFSQEVKVGDILQGQITRLAQFGAFVEIRPGIEGLIHLSELSATKQVKLP